MRTFHRYRLADLPASMPMPSRTDPPSCHHPNVAQLHQHPPLLFTVLRQSQRDPSRFRSRLPLLSDRITLILCRLTKLIRRRHFYHRQFDIHALHQMVRSVAAQAPRSSDRIVQALIVRKKKMTSTPQRRYRLPRQARLLLVFAGCTPQWT